MAVLTAKFGGGFRAVSMSLANYYHAMLHAFSIRMTIALVRSRCAARLPNTCTPATMSSWPTPWTTPQSTQPQTTFASLDLPTNPVSPDSRLAAADLLRC